MLSLETVQKLYVAPESTLKASTFTEIQQMENHKDKQLIQKIEIVLISIQQKQFSQIYKIITKFPNLQHFFLQCENVEPCPPESAKDQFFVFLQDFFIICKVIQLINFEVDFKQKFRILMMDHQLKLFKNDYYNKDDIFLFFGYLFDKFFLPKPVQKPPAQFQQQQQQSVQTQQQQKPINSQQLQQQPQPLSSQLSGQQSSSQQQPQSKTGQTQVKQPQQSTSSSSTAQQQQQKAGTTQQKPIQAQQQLQPQQQQQKTGTTQSKPAPSQQQQPIQQQSQTIVSSSQQPSQQQKQTFEFQSQLIPCTPCDTVQLFVGGSASTSSSSSNQRGVGESSEDSDEDMYRHDTVWQLVFWCDNKNQDNKVFGLRRWNSIQILPKFQSFLLQKVFVFLNSAREAELRFESFCSSAEQTIEHFLFLPNAKTFDYANLKMPEMRVFRFRAGRFVVNQQQRVYQMTQKFLEVNAKNALKAFEFAFGSFYTIRLDSDFMSEDYYSNEKKDEKNQVNNFQGKMRMKKKIIFAQKQQDNSLWEFLQKVLEFSARQGWAKHFTFSCPFYRGEQERQLFIEQSKEEEFKKIGNDPNSVGEIEDQQKKPTIHQQIEQSTTQINQQEIQKTTEQQQQQPQSQAAQQQQNSTIQQLEKEQKLPQQQEQLQQQQEENAQIQQDEQAPQENEQNNEELPASKRYAMLQEVLSERKKTILEMQKDMLSKLQNKMEHFEFRVKGLFKVKYETLRQQLTLDISCQHTLDGSLYEMGKNLYEKVFSEAKRIVVYARDAPMMGQQQWKEDISSFNNIKLKELEQYRKQTIDQKQYEILQFCIKLQSLKSNQCESFEFNAWGLFSIEIVNEKMLLKVSKSADLGADTEQKLFNYYYKLFQFCFSKFNNVNNLPQEQQQQQQEEISPFGLQQQQQQQQFKFMYYDQSHRFWTPVLNAEGKSDLFVHIHEDLQISLPNLDFLVKILLAYYNSNEKIDENMKKKLQQQLQQQQSLYTQNNNKNSQQIQNNTNNKKDTKKNSISTTLSNNIIDNTNNNNNLQSKSYNERVNNGKEGELVLVMNSLIEQRVFDNFELFLRGFIQISWRLLKPSSLLLFDQSGKSGKNSKTQSLCLSLKDEKVLQLLNSKKITQMFKQQSISDSDQNISQQQQLQAQNVVEFVFDQWEQPQQLKNSKNQRINDNNNKNQFQEVYEKCLEIVKSVAPCRNVKFQFRNQPINSEDSFQPSILMKILQNVGAQEFSFVIFQNSVDQLLKEKLVKQILMEDEIQPVLSQQENSGNELLVAGNNNSNNNIRKGPLSGFENVEVVYRVDGKSSLLYQDSSILENYLRILQKGRKAKVQKRITDLRGKQKQKLIKENLLSDESGQRRNQQYYYEDLDDFFRRLQEESRTDNLVKSKDNVNKQDNNNNTNNNNSSNKDQKGNMEEILSPNNQQQRKGNLKRQDSSTSPSPEVRKTKVLVLQQEINDFQKIRSESLKVQQEQEDLQEAIETSIMQEYLAGIAEQQNQQDSCLDEQKLLEFLINSQQQQQLQQQQIKTNGQSQSTLQLQQKSPLTVEENQAFFMDPRTESSTLHLEIKKKSKKEIEVNLGVFVDEDLLVWQKILQRLFFMQQQQQQNQSKKRKSKLVQQQEQEQAEEEDRVSLGIVVRLPLLRKMRIISTERLMMLDLEVQVVVIIEPNEQAAYYYNNVVSSTMLESNEIKISNNKNEGNNNNTNQQQQQKKNYCEWDKLAQDIDIIMSSINQLEVFKLRVRRKFQILQESQLQQDEQQQQQGSELKQQLISQLQANFLKEIMNSKVLTDEINLNKQTKKALIQCNIDSCKKKDFVFGWVMDFVKQRFAYLLQASLTLQFEKSFFLQFDEEQQLKREMEEQQQQILIQQEQELQQQFKLSQQQPAQQNPEKSKENINNNKNEEPQLEGVIDLSRAPLDVLKLHIINNDITRRMNQVIDLRRQMKNLLAQPILQSLEYEDAGAQFRFQRHSQYFNYKITNLNSNNSTIKNNDSNFNFSQQSASNMNNFNQSNISNANNNNNSLGNYNNNNFSLINNKNEFSWCSVAIKLKSQSEFNEAFSVLLEDDQIRMRLRRIHIVLDFSYSRNFDVKPLIILMMKKPMVALVSAACTIMEGPVKYTNVVKEGVAEKAENYVKKAWEGVNKRAEGLQKKAKRLFVVKEIIKKVLGERVVDDVKKFVPLQ